MDKSISPVVEEEMNEIERQIVRLFHKHPRHLSMTRATARECGIGGDADGIELVVVVVCLVNEGALVCT